MNDVEKLHAAIYKLEILRGGGVSRLGWNTYQYDWRMLVAGAADSDEALIIADARAANPDDFELIVTLHRTIDAQLAILREAKFQLSGAPQARGFIGNEFSLFMKWVDAILEEAHA